MKFDAFVQPRGGDKSPIIKYWTKLQRFSISVCTQRLAGFTAAGEGKHVDLPRAWTQLLLLSSSNGNVRNGVSMFPND